MNPFPTVTDTVTDIIRVLRLLTYGYYHLSLNLHPDACIRLPDAVNQF